MMNAAALALLLAQTCVAELSFPTTTAECVAMWEVNARNAARREVTLEQQTLEFNAYWRVAARRAERPWVGALKASGKPEGWPVKLSWRNHRNRWGAIMARAVRFVGDLAAGHHRPVCRRADDYGGDPDDGKHADDAKPCRYAVRVHCIPEGKQAFWDLAVCRQMKRGRAQPR